MFKYSSQKSISLDQTFCIIGTTIIADKEGFFADIESTEVREVSSVIAKFYRTYYEFIVGSHNLNTESTEGGLTLNEYNTQYYDKIAYWYDYNKSSNGEDAFIKFSQIEQFSMVFRRSLLATTANVVIEELRKDGYSDDDIKNATKQFKSDFNIKFNCLTDEIILMNHNSISAWKYLYDKAIDMPHVVIGLRKKLSSIDSTFFSQNRGNLDILVTFVRNVYKNEVKTPYMGFDNGYRIAGIIVNNFGSYLAKRFIGEYGSVVSSGSATYEDDEGIVLSGSELQGKMFSESNISDLDDFEHLIKLIDTGSRIYDFQDGRYFNLIEWRQNKLKMDLVDALSKSTLANKLDKLNLKIGGYLENVDIAAGILRNATQDKRIRIESIDKIITDGFNTNIDSSSARRKIDEWIMVERREYDRVNGVVSNSNKLKSGRSVMSFKYKDVTSNGDRTNRLTNTNYKMFKDLLIGIQALHILEHEINSMDYVFLSFPSKGYTNEKHRLVTGLSLNDYLRFEDGKIDNVDIERDVVGDIEFMYQTTIDEVSRKDAEILSIYNSIDDVDDISFDSLVDDDFMMVIDDDSDAELLKFLNHNNIKISVSDNKSSGTIKDIVFNSIYDSIADVCNNCFLSPRAFIKNMGGGSVNGYSLIISKIKCIAQIVEWYAVHGNLTYGDDNCVLNVSTLYASYINGKDLSVEYLSGLTGRMLSEYDIEELKGSLFCEQNIQCLIRNSDLHYSFFIKNKDGKFMCSSKFLDRNGLSPLGKLVSSIDKRLVSTKTCIGVTSCSTLKEVCIAATKYTNAVFDTKFNIDDKFYLPRAICFCINIRVVISYIRYAIIAIAMHIKDYRELFIERSNKLVYNDTNSDDVVNVSLIMKTLKSLDSLDISNNNSSKYTKLKIYEGLYNDFFDSVDYKKFSDGDPDRALYDSIVFMDSIQAYLDSVDDIEERVFQYSEVSKIARSIIRNKKLLSINFGGNEYSIYDFITVVERICEFDKEQMDNEYMVNRVSRRDIDESMQIEISGGIVRYITEHDINIDNSSTWLDNLMEYFNNSNGLSLTSNTYNEIKFRYNDYAINHNGLLTLNGRVVHTTNRNASGRKTYMVVTRYGIFECVGSNCRLVDRLEDSKWILY